MSKRLLSAALIASLGLAFVPGANAVDGTITINGLVLDSTCTVVGGNNFAVQLPTVKTTDFASGVAGKTQFDIKLSNCPTGTDYTPLKVSALFSSTSGTIDAATGYLMDKSAVDNGVSIELLEGDGTTSIDLRKTTDQNGESATVNDADGTATLSYFAQYHKTGAAAVGVGRVTTSVEYTLNYL